MPINNNFSINIPSPFTTASTSTELSNSLSSTASNAVPVNANRRGLTIYNTLEVDVFIDKADTVDETSYWFKLPAGSYYEMPVPIYTGALWFYIETGTGSVEIRELT